jgi:uncharacterized membrane protein YqiK
VAHELGVRNCKTRASPLRPLLERKGLSFATPEIEDFRKALTSADFLTANGRRHSALKLERRWQQTTN